MTPSKSDSQLDAEADQPQRPLEQAIEHHRYLFSLDLYIPKLSADAPAVFTDPQTGEERAEEMAAIGLTFNARFERYITGAYGRTFLWSRAAFRQWAECVRCHPEHSDREEFDGSLCRALVGLVVRQDYALERACLRLGLTPERAGRTLGNALMWIESDFKRLMALQEARDKEDAGRFSIYDRPPEHHVVPGLHPIDCHQCHRTRSTFEASCGPCRNSKAA